MFLANHVAISLVLALILLSGTACKQQEAKSGDRGKAVMSDIKAPEKSAQDAVSKVQDNASQVEQKADAPAPENK